MSDELRERLSRLAEDVDPEAPNVATFQRQGRRRRRIRMTLTALVAAVLALAITVPLWALSHLSDSKSVSAAVSPCSADWREFDVPNPGNTGSGLRGISVLSPDDAWAVGVSGSVPPGWLNQTPAPGSLGGPAPPELQTPLVLHWDGTSWSQIAAPNHDATNEGDYSVGGTSFASVAAISADDVWAVGGGQGPVIEHWDGQTWSFVPSPDVNLVDGTLTSVAGTGATDAWAVGSGGANGGIAPVIEHWDGSRWSLTPTPDVGARDSELTQVVALSPSNAWAVGQAWDQPLALHWDGQVWTRVPVPNVRAVRLNGIAAVSADDLWAVGTDYRDVNGDAPAHGVIYHWDGSAWSLESAPLPAAESSLDHVSASGPGDLWARGTGDPDHALLLQGDHEAWKVATPPSDQPSPGSWSGIAASDDGSVWLVGSTSSPSVPFVGRFCPG